MDNTIDRSTGDYHCQHSAAEWPELATLRWYYSVRSVAAVMTMSALLSVCVDSPWAEWRRELEAARCPWRSLKYLDLNGRLSCRVLQIIVAEVGVILVNVICM